VPPPCPVTADSEKPRWLKSFAVIPPRWVNPSPTYASLCCYFSIRPLIVLQTVCFLCESVCDRAPHCTDPRTSRVPAEGVLFMVFAYFEFFHLFFPLRAEAVGVLAFISLFKTLVRFPHFRLGRLHFCRLAASAAPSFFIPSPSPLRPLFRGPSLHVEKRPPSPSSPSTWFRWQVTPRNIPLLEKGPPFFFRLEGTPAYGFCTLTPSSVWERYAA